MNFYEFIDLVEKNGVENILIMMPLGDSDELGAFKITERTYKVSEHHKVEFQYINDKNKIVEFYIMDFVKLVKAHPHKYIVNYTNK